VIGSLAHHRRGSVPLTALAVPVLAVPAFVGSVAFTAPATAVEAADELAAVRLLHRAMAAPEAVSYTGTQYVAAWSSLDSRESISAVVDVIHRAGGFTQVRAHGARTLSAVDERSSTGWLADGGGPVGLLVRTHDVAVVGVGSVAGRPAHVVEARRGDGTAAARLWLDTESALPLRREVYNEDGSTRTASAFIEFSLERAPRPVLATGSVRTADSALRRSDLSQLRGDGWSCPDRIGDGLVLYEARRVGDAVQLSYSDGVATVSVFEQRGHLDEEKLHGFAAREVDGGMVYSSSGPPAQLTWSVGDWVVTVVADAPAETINSVLAAMPPQEPEYEHGFLARIGKGAERLASWLNPFG
jgi:sigma-E factor negative regulatory protein RseB